MGEFKRHINAERGQGLVEYGLILVVVAVIVIVVLFLLGLSGRISRALRPELLVFVAGGATIIAAMLFVYKTLAWKIGLHLASKCAELGKTNVALEILYLSMGDKVPIVWDRLIGVEQSREYTDPVNVLPFYRLANAIAQNLSSKEQIVSLTKLGRLFNKLGRFDEALREFKSAESLFYRRDSSVGIETQLELFTGAGVAYIHSEGYRISNIRRGCRHLTYASNIAAETSDSEVEVREVILKGFNEAANELTLSKVQQAAYGGANIKECKDGRTLYVGETYTLETGIAWEDEPNRFIWAPISLPRSVSVGPLKLEVAVWAEDIEIEPAWIETLEVTPASTHSLTKFRLTPKAVGRKALGIDFYFQRNWLQQVKFELEVVESPTIVQDLFDKGIVTRPPLSVGMLLGVGGLGDESFNDSAYGGLEFARQLYDIKVEHDHARTLEENRAILEQWSKARLDLIIAIGYENGPAVADVAESYPEIRFAVIDTEVKANNTWSAVFREYEGDYVVGALAALVTGKAGNEGLVGFIGGVRTPTIERIESAFCQGIESVNPNITLRGIYVDKFDDEIMGEYFAEILYAAGADVIYQAAGRSGIGAIRAAERLRKLIISTGGDHSQLAPDTVLTSRVKNVNCPVLDVIEAVLEHRFEGGRTVSYGLVDGGLSLIPIRPQVTKRLHSSIDILDLRTFMQKTTKAVIGGHVDFAEWDRYLPSN